MLCRLDQIEGASRGALDERRPADFHGRHRFFLLGGAKRRGDDPARRSSRRPPEGGCMAKACARINKGLRPTVTQIKKTVLRATRVESPVVRLHCTFSHSSSETAMSDPVAFWHAEHVNFAILLDLLEGQLDRFHRGVVSRLRAHARHHVLHDALPGRTAPSKGRLGLRQDRGARNQRPPGRGRTRRTTRAAQARR